MNPETQPTQSAATPPTKETIVAFLTEQLEIKKLQAELQALNTSLAVGRANELEAMAKIQHFSQKGSLEDNPDIVQHTVSQEDVDNNPEFAAQGIKAGDVVGIPKEAYNFLNLGKTKEEDSKENVKASSPLSVVQD